MNIAIKRITLDQDQLRAVELCERCDQGYRTVAVTGQAGTGKTSIIKEAVARLTNEFGDGSVVVCAPTGKAAKRITEATGLPAQTIHRLLEFPAPGELDDHGKPMVPGVPGRDRQNPIEAKIVFVDEATMVGWQLFDDLVNALPSGGMLRLFGDVNQLAPVEQDTTRSHMSPFAKMLALHKDKVVVLTHIYRQDETSTIVLQGDRIINGRMPQQAPDFLMHVTEQPILKLQQIVAVDPLIWAQLDRQMISAVKNGWIGTLAVNKMMQDKLLNHQYLNGAVFMELDRHKWNKKADPDLTVYENDKVIWTKNNYDLKIYNGETGKIHHIDTDEGIIWIDFGDRVVEVPDHLEGYDRDGGKTYYNPQKDIDLAYCLTTHKSQGSEYDEVIYMMHSSRSFLLNRNNLYTGITRAKKKVQLLTDSKGLRTALRKSEQDAYKKVG